MEIRANEKKIINTQPLDYLFTQGETGVDQIPIVLPLQYGQVDLTALHWSIQLASERDTFISKALTAQVGEDCLTVYWEVDGDCTAVPGKIQLTVVGISADGAEVIKFDGREIMVKAAAYGSYVPTPDTLAASLSQAQKYTGEAILAAQQATAAAASAATDAQAAQAAVQKGPYVGENGHWFLYDAAAAAYEDSGVSAYGAEGKSPYVGEDGYWYQWNQTQGVYQKTGFLAQGPKGDAGSVSSVNGILPDENGNVQVPTGSSSADDITETAARVFVSPGEKSKWNGLPGGNLVINGDMQVWQRGESLTAIGSNAYTADRYIMHQTSTAQYTVEKHNDPEMGICMKITCTAAGWINLGTVVELTGVFPALTGSFYAKSSREVTLSAILSPDSYDATTSASAEYVISSQWQRYTLSSAGLTAAGKMYFTLLRGGSIQSGDVFYLAKVQLEAGEQATAFAPRPYAEELALCQRYYKVRTLVTGWMPTSATAGSAYHYFGYTNDGMRVVPTVPSSVSGAVINQGTWANVTATTSLNGTRIIFTVSNAASQRSGYAGYGEFQITMDAEIY
ncbi:MAG: hypothetical protein PHE47_08720 [Oscillospiraceae bacterium]|nr:hypothetical protein [Oscillospiraceae bacterium]